MHQMTPASLSPDKPPGSCISADFQKVEFEQNCWCSPAGGAPIPCWCKDYWFATQRQREAAVQSGVHLEKISPHLPSKEGGFCCNLQGNAGASPSVLVYTPRRATLTHLPSEEGGFCYKASVCSKAVLCSSTSTSTTCATGASGVPLVLVPLVHATGASGTALPAWPCRRSLNHM